MPLGRHCEGEPQLLPGRLHRAEKIAEGRLREAARQQREVAVGALERLGEQAGAGVRRDAGGEQRIQFDQTLRQHAQLAAAVHRLRVARGFDDLLRDLPDPLLGVHRGAAQHPKRVLLGDLPRPHQDALGTIDQFAFVEAVVDGRELRAQQLVVAEAGLRDMDHRAQPLRTVAVDHVGVNAGAGRLVDLGDHPGRW